MHTVAVLAFEGISPFHLSVPCMVFGDDLARLGVPRYELLVCGERRGLIPTLSGFNIEVPHDLSALARADTVIVPAWRDPDEPPPPALLDALRATHARGARVAVSYTPLDVYKRQVSATACASPTRTVRACSTAT